MLEIKIGKSRQATDNVRGAVRCPRLELEMAESMIRVFPH